MFDLIIERLASFGYTEISENDKAIIDFAIDKVTSTIKNECYTAEIPQGLLHIAVDMVIGEFLKAKKAFSPDELGIDLDAAVKQLSEGDSSVTFAVGDGSQTAEQRLDALIEHLLTYGFSEFSAFRRIKW